MAHEAGYREWRPAEVLSRHLMCTWAGRLGSDGTPFTDRVLPDGCADQAHLTRECGRLGGVPPGRLVPRLVPAV